VADTGERLVEVRSSLPKGLGERAERQQRCPQALRLGLEVLALGAGLQLGLLAGIQAGLQGGGTLARMGGLLGGLQKGLCGVAQAGVALGQLGCQLGYASFAGGQTLLGGGSAEGQGQGTPTDACVA
jgi:hypothetical protein